MAIVAVHLMAGSLRVARQPLLLAIGLVAAVEVFSFLLTRWENGTRDTFAVLIYACLAVFTAHVISDRRRLLVLGLAAAISAAIVAGIAIAQEIGHFYLWQAAGNDVLGRRNSTFGDPNVASRFLAIGLISCLALLSVPRLPRPAVVLAAVIPAFLAIGDALTLSRVGWVLAAVAMLPWLLAFRSDRRVRVGILVFSIAFVSYLTIAPTLIGRASTIAADGLAQTGVIDGLDGPTDLPGEGDLKTTTALDPVIRYLPLDTVRKYLIRAGVAMALDHPLLGVGVGGFQPEIESSYWGFVPLDRRGNPTTLIHTDSVRVVAETGIVGLAAFLAVLGSVAVVVWRKGWHGKGIQRTAVLAAGGVILVILIGSQFAARFYNEPVFWLALGVLLATSRSVPWLDDAAPNATSAVTTDQPRRDAPDPARIATP